MTKPFIRVIFLCLMAAACRNETTTDESLDSYSMNGPLSSFVSSDSLYNQTFEAISAYLNSADGNLKGSYLEALPYYTKVKKWVAVEEDPAKRIDLLWYAYIQTGNKVFVGIQEMWDLPMGGLIPPSEEAPLVEQFQYHQHLQRLAYLAISSGKDSIAQASLQAANSLFQEKIKGAFDEETHSYGLTIEEDLQGLAMDLIPSGHENPIMRNVLSYLLSNGMEADFSPSTLKILLPTLSKYGQHDLAVQLMPDLEEGFVGKWLMTDVVGIKSNLSAPGFANPILQPKVTPGLEFAEGQLKTPKGLIYLRWDKVKPFRIQVKVPEKASLLLPVSNPSKATIFANKSRIWMGAKPQPTPPGVRFLDVNKEGIVVELTKGKYLFQIKN